MKHESIKALYRYWDALRAGEAAPPRTAVEPAEISQQLRDTFILESANGSYRFRLAGTRLCAIFGKELKGASFLDIWPLLERPQIASLLGAVADEGCGAVVGVSGRGRRDREVAFELLLLPLIQSGPLFDRVLGAMAPMQLPFWLGVEPFLELSVTSARLLSSGAAIPATSRGPAQPAIVPATVPALGTNRRRSRFVVLEGGKSG